MRTRSRGQARAAAVGSFKGPSRERGATGKTRRERTADVAHDEVDFLASHPNHEGLSHPVGLKLSNRQANNRLLHGRTRRPFTG
jgi:hypothetical protein